MSAAELAWTVRPIRSASLGHSEVATLIGQDVSQLKAQSQHVLGRALEALNEIGDDDRTGLFSDWSPSRLLVYEGTCSMLLGDSKRAIDHLTQFPRESETDDGNLSVRLAATVDTASAYANSGDLDAAYRTLADVYARLVEVGDHRGTGRALNAVKRLQPWRKRPEVRQLDEQIRAIGTLAVAG